MSHFKPPIILLCLVFAGCATVYRQGQGEGQGYFDAKVDGDVFRVGFRGNESAPMKEIEDFALLRCAEVALANGFAYFRIVATPTLKPNDVPEATTETSRGFYYDNTYIFKRDERSVVPAPVFVRRAYKQFLIRCFRGKPDGEGRVYDAGQVEKDVRELYHLPGKN